MIIKQTPFRPHQQDLQALGSDQKNIVAKTVDTSISVDLEGLDDQINSMISLTEKVDHANRKMVTCNVCGNEGPRAFVVRHIEAKHITGVSHPCDICGKTARSRNALIVHKSTYHKWNLCSCLRSRHALRAHKYRDHWTLIVFFSGQGTGWINTKSFINIKLCRGHCK